ncbi:hypothetical protein CFC21_055359 [Triticum aestivum]|uniref:Pectinesterase inhibitor domain-containing protein n=2 Tax=Triticum aestivum TaxID=4565 RepID=A0A3B6I466_WHEAT|nr:uncharacterized protein LOC123083401 [Triticum aestivum]KAF7046327.1 hypothetical protein CFC21_055359 [Triticum aestivum]
MATTLISSIIFSASLFVIFSMAITAKANDSGSGRAKVTNLMLEACKNASGYSRDFELHVTQEFCLSTLQSSNRSVDARDHLDLVLIAIDILKDRLNTANHNVEKMLQNAKKGTVKIRDLYLCKVYYDTTTRIINICDSMFTDYRGDKGELQPFELLRWVDRVGFPIDGCMSNLSIEKPRADSLINENFEMAMLVNLGYALLAPYDDSY